MNEEIQETSSSRYDFEDWPELDIDPDLIIGLKIRPAIQKPSCNRVPPKSTIIPEQSLASTPVKKSWLQKIRGSKKKAPSSSSHPNIYSREMPVVEHGNTSDLLLTVSQAKDIQDKFHVTEADNNTPEMIQWKQLRPHFKIEDAIEKALPFILADYHDPYFAEMIVTKYGNYKTHLALLSNDPQEQKEAIQYLILEYEADVASRGR